MISIDIMNGLTFEGVLFTLTSIAGVIGLIIIDINLIKGTLHNKHHRKSNPDNVTN